MGIPQDNGYTHDVIIIIISFLNPIKRYTQKFRETDHVS